MTRVNTHNLNFKNMSDANEYIKDKADIKDNRVKRKRYKRKNRHSKRRKDDD